MYRKWPFIGSDFKGPYFWSWNVPIYEHLPITYIHRVGWHFKNYFSYSGGVKTHRSARISRLFYSQSQYFLTYAFTQYIWELHTGRDSNLGSTCGVRDEETVKRGRDENRLPTVYSISSEFIIGH
jgi:hypothetical protein